MINPLGGMTTYSYDSNNRLTSLVDPYNDITMIEYDILVKKDKEDVTKWMLYHMKGGKKDGCFFE